MSDKKELSQLARQILSENDRVTMYTQSELEKAIWFTNRACSDLVAELAAQEDEGEVATALKNASEAIRKRISL